MIKKIIQEITPPIIWSKISKARSEKSNKTNPMVQPMLPLSEWAKEDFPNKIFVHIHKCAGTSIWGSLNKYPNFLCYIARPGRFAHGLGSDQISKEVWNNAFKFTIVRNPFARVFSAYKMFQGNRWSHVFSDFSEFVEIIQWCDVDNHKVPKFVPRNDYVKFDNIIHHCSSFHNPKYRLNEMDYIGKLEEIDKVLDFLAPRFGVDQVKLPKLNATKPDSYRDYYNEATQKIIAKKYARDIERFNYKF